MTQPSFRLIERMQIRWSWLQTATSRAPIVLPSFLRGYSIISERSCLCATIYMTLWTSRKRWTVQSWLFPMSSWSSPSKKRRCSFPMALICSSCTLTLCRYARMKQLTTADCERGRTKTANKSLGKVNCVPDPWRWEPIRFSGLCWITASPFLWVVGPTWPRKLYFWCWRARRL